MKDGNPFSKMHLDEIEQRAQLFYQLKYDKGHARARIRQNLEWEFEQTPAPGMLDKVDEIIKRVYKE
jgi:hypothetical protein